LSANGMFACWDGITAQVIATAAADQRPAPASTRAAQAHRLDAVAAGSKPDSTSQSRPKAANAHQPTSKTRKRRADATLSSGGNAPAPASTSQSARSRG